MIFFQSGRPWSPEGMSIVGLAAKAPPGKGLGRQGPLGACSFTNFCKIYTISQILDSFREQAAPRIPFDCLSKLEGACSFPFHHVLLQSTTLPGLDEQAA